MPKNIIFQLNNLEEYFGYKLLNNGLVTLANIGNTTLDVRNVKNYSIILEVESLSSIINSEDINFSFLLSYRTKISQINLDKSGSLFLSDEYKTNVTLEPGCYHVVLHSLPDESEEIINFENEFCASELSNHMNIYNYNKSLHDIYLV